MKGMRDWAMWESGVEHLVVRRASANVLGRGGGSIPVMFLGLQGAHCGWTGRVQKDIQLER